MGYSMGDSLFVVSTVPARDDVALVTIKPSNVLLVYSEKSSVMSETSVSGKKKQTPPVAVVAPVRATSLGDVQEVRINSPVKPILDDLDQGPAGGWARALDSSHSKPSACMPSIISNAAGKDLIWRYVPLEMLS
jgi:hypothetical protein